MDESRQSESTIVDAERPPELTIIYEVQIRRTDKGRVVASLHRGDYAKDLAHVARDGKSLTFLSKKPRHFFDEEDERRVLSRCQELSERGEARVGSIELCLFLYAGPRVEVKFLGGVLLGQWTPGDGLRFEEGAHPVFNKDKTAIALHCWQLPQGSGGVFARTDFSPEPAGVLSPKR